MLFRALFAHRQPKRFAVEPFDFGSLLLATTMATTTVLIRFHADLDLSVVSRDCHTVAG